MKKLFFAYSWILLTVGVMLTSVAAYNFYLIPKKLITESIPENSGDYNILGYQKIEEGDNQKVLGIKSIVETGDARVEIITRFLDNYRSPMTPHSYYGQFLVDLADEYQLDFRLLPAIAMKESGLCKNTHSEAPHNCLGFGIHSGGTLDFTNYEAGFERAAKELRAYYIEEGRTTVAEIAEKYNGGDYLDWADAVNQFMTEMRYNDRELGREIDQNNSALEYTREE